MTDTEPNLSKPKRGGWANPAAAENGKKGGAPTKYEEPFTCQIKLMVSEETEKSLAATARVDGVTRQDLIRTAIDFYLRDRQFL